MGCSCDGSSICAFLMKTVMCVSLRAASKLGIYYTADQLDKGVCTARQRGLHACTAVLQDAPSAHSIARLLCVNPDLTQPDIEHWGGNLWMFIESGQSAIGGWCVGDL